MPILIIFSFIAGVVTVLSPCILPILPIVLSSSVGTGEESKKRPYGVMLGFILSFTFFTLFLSSIVKATGVSADLIRNISVIVIFAFGISLISKKIQSWFEELFSKMSRFFPSGSQKTGFGGGFLLGLSIGLLWTPCVGPILASVISLALIGDVSFAALIITLSYSIGTAIPMFLIIKGGNTVLQKVPWLTSNLGKIQKAFGVLMIATAVLIYFQVDRKFQSFVLNAFPNYGVGLTKIEDTDIVKEQLDKLQEEDLVFDEITVSTESLMYPRKGKAPELVSDGPWINSEPLTLDSLKGKVVLIDFWTYTCINCQRTFPYLRDWWSKYEDDGLVIIAVHAPEFEFEKEYDNVLKASQDFDLQYPIVQDNEFKTWRAYSNRYWPAKYIVDKEGYVRYTHSGEGAYDETEQVIQALLKEGGSTVDEKISNPIYSNYARTPELYLGSERISAFSSNEKPIFGEFVTYSVPKTLLPNRFAYNGDWKIMPEYSIAKPGGELVLNFESKDVYLVMVSEDGPSTVEVYLDDVLVKKIEVTSDSLYPLIENENPGKHELNLKFIDGNIEIYAFTFG